MITKNEFLGLMARCHKHNDFFDVGDNERNIVWFPLMPKDLSMAQLEKVIDSHYSEHRRQIMIADFGFAAIKIRREQARKTPPRADSFMGLPFPNDMSDKNHERIELLRKGHRFPLSDEWPLSENEKRIAAQEARNENK